MENIDVIDQYLLGLLADEEENQFERKIANDPNLRLEVQTRRHISLAAGESALIDKKKMLATYEKHLSEKLDTHQSENSNKKTTAINLYRIMSIAAMLVILCSLYWASMDQISTFDKKVAQNFEPYPSHITITRSGNSNIDDAQTTAAHALYQNGKYAEAALLFEKIYTHKADTLSLFYAGVSYIGAKDQKNAKRIFEYPINWKVNSLYLDKIKSILE